MSPTMSNDKVDKEKTYSLCEHCEDKFLLDKLNDNSLCSNCEDSCVRCEGCEEYVDYSELDDYHVDYCRICIQMSVDDRKENPRYGW